MPSATTAGQTPISWSSTTARRAIWRDCAKPLVAEHATRDGGTSDLVVGLQLTHSGRFSRPDRKAGLQPQIVYRHPVLDRKFQLPPAQAVLSDDDIAALVGDFVLAARLAHDAGFAFVDIKHCHGYLGHEFLSAVDRPGRYGGSLENRTRFLREIVAGIHSQTPGLLIGVRFSAADWVPFRARESDGVGEPEPLGELAVYRHAFGGDGTGLGVDLAEPCRLLDLLAELDIHLVCVTVGSPYYNPHRQRPAFFPPSDGYLPPDDPLVGVACQLDVTARLKRIERISRSWAPATRTCKIGCRTWRKQCCVPGRPTSSAWVAWR